MIEFKELRIKNVGLYKSAVFNLDYKGISVILGDNRQANPGGTNAVGKSWLFQMLPETLGITPPLVKKREKRKSGYSTVVFKKDDHIYEASLKVTGSREHYVIKRDGKDTKVRTKGWAEQKLAQLIDRTEDEFYSLDYIDSGRPHPLHRGTTQLRRDFIISMFRLSNVDTLRKLFNTELRRISEDRSVYDEVRRQHKGLAEQLVDESESSLEEKAEKLEKQYKKLSIQIQALGSKVDLIKFREENKNNIQRLQKATKGDLNKYEDVLEAYSNKVDALELQFKNAMLWTKYSEQVKEYIRRLSPYKTLLEKYNVKADDVIKGATIYDKFFVKYKMTKSSIADLRNTLPNKEEINELLAEVDIESLRTRITNLKSLFEIAKKFEGGLCPLCGSSVKAHNPEEIKKKLEKLERREKRATLEKKKLELIKQRRKQIKTIRELNEMKQHLRNKLREYAHFKELVILANKLPDRPDVFSGEKLDEGTIQIILNKSKKRFDFLKSMQPIINKIQACLELTTEDEQEVAQYEIIRQSLDKVVKKLPTVRSTLDKMRSVKTEMAKLKERANELKDSVEDEEAYKLLVEAYGNAGIKKLMLQRIGAHLESGLNRYSKFVFSERYQFKVRIDTQFDILVKRQYANRSLVSDVRKLSGAESRAYVLLLFLSLLSLIPASRRTNLLILDEPSQNFGPEMRENFARFLQVLVKVVPHIIIITPLSDERYAGARYFTVVKEHGYSKLIKGLTT